MAQLSSPGVSVSVIDESFYTPAAPGTVPLIIVASEEGKQNGAGSGTAPGTLKENAGKVYLLTSQKDLSDTFGTPVFKTDANNNPIHAGEQNEYGLQTAYSFLGVSNRAYVVRADIDLGQLDATAVAPVGAPVDGSFWFDTASTKFGIFEWNGASATAVGGQTFKNKVPVVITAASQTTGGDAPAPLASVGSIGDYAIVATTTLMSLWYKKPLTNTAAGTWVEVGTTDWAASWPTARQVSANATIVENTTIEFNSLGIPGTITALADWATTDLASAINSNNAIRTLGITAEVINGFLEIYSTGVDVTVSGDIATALGLSADPYIAPKLKISKHTQIPAYKIAENAGTASGMATGSLWIKTTNPNLGADWIVKRYSTAKSAWAITPSPLYKNNAEALAGLDTTGGGINLAVGTIFVKYNDSEVVDNDNYSQFANFKIYARSATGATSIVSTAVAANTFSASTTYEFTISETTAGSTSYSAPTPVSFTLPASPAPTALGNARLFVETLNAALPQGSNVVATLSSTTNQITIIHKQGGDIKFVDSTNEPILKLFANSTNFQVDPTSNLTDGKYVASLWVSSVGGVAFVTSSATAPTTEPVDGQLWYNSIVDEVDIMIHNGTTWVGYLDATAKTINHAGIVNEPDTDPAGPIVSASQPTKQSDSTDLANGDLWIDTSDLENYPRIYKYNGSTKKWVLVDSSDQTTENGVLFHDARWNDDGRAKESSSIKTLLSSNFLDPDAPDPALYPKGMILWNLRRSGFNVKRFVANYIDTTQRNLRFNDEAMGTVGDEYYANRWVSEAANQENGAGTFGRKAQRKVVVQKLQALVNSNQQIRDEESRIFNLIATPGYPELIGEMISLNYDRGITAFVIGDTPARLAADATTLSNWGNNTAGALEDNDDGLVSFDEYLGVFYPWGYTSDNIGNNVVVPPSHMMLRTIALSDQVSYPWFAPAGTRRGGITNATAVGYIDSTSGEFQSVALNNGQRDTLAAIKVNPLTFITGTGLVNYGQYTRAKNASALDRINVARLVIYLRRQFAQLAKPYVFEPNDKITRDEIKGAAESLLLELVGQRALYDYIVVCDTTNNTPARIDRSELYLDVAIEPVKAVEFIYIPLRLKNTGEIKALGGA